MYFTKSIFALLFALVFFSSCEKEEPIEPTPSKLETMAIPMGSDYAKQCFFDLETKTIVAQNDRWSWDLAFESSADGYHIFLNSAKLMYAKNTGKKNFNQVYSYSYDQRTSKYDMPSGNPDSTAIGEWGQKSAESVSTYGDVYIIDRGMDRNNQPIPPKKMIVQGLSNNTYNIRFADLDGSNEHEIAVPKNADYNRIFLSLDGAGSLVQVEPAKDTWDLAFTMYTHIFYEAPSNIPLQVDTLPYLVNGVLLNQNGVMAARDTSIDFDSLMISDADNFTYSDVANTIGYDWKSFEFDEENYVIDSKLHFVVKTVEGNVFKLRFTDFYDEQGIKGTPTFQFQQLK
ncbi:MAG: HmuY family protein [Chitinophagales bacterium]|nr:HmuY family protein [Chitinophagales bacterium]